MNKAIFSCDGDMVSLSLVIKTHPLAAYGVAMACVAGSALEGQFAAPISKNGTRDVADVRYMNDVKFAQTGLGSQLSVPNCHL